jgi:hypothetical protein
MNICGRSARRRRRRRRFVIVAALASCASMLAIAEPAAAQPPENVSPPMIFGDAVEGETLTGSTGDWTGADSFAYQWLRSNDLGGYDPIVGANTDTYVLIAADVQHEIVLEVTASNTTGQERAALSAPTDTVAPAPEIDRSLGLFVGPRLKAYKRATIRAQGVARPSLKLWVYENLRGEGCAETPAERNRRSRMLIDALPVSGDFDEQRRPRMKKPGRHAFCAYLGPNQNTATMTTFATRRVRKPLLRESRAEQAVAAALARHGFTNRVVANLQETCTRRNRSVFDCRFSSSFPGYRLTGAGSVALKRRLSFRFQVFAQGRSFVLID